MTTLPNIVFVGVARESFNTLVLLGHFGQFVSVSLVILAFLCFLAIKMERKSERRYVGLLEVESMKS